MVSAKFIATAVLASTAAASAAPDAASPVNDALLPIPTDLPGGFCFPIDIGQIIFGLASLATDLLYAYYDGFYVRVTSHLVDVLELALKVIYAPDYACILQDVLSIPIEILHAAASITGVAAILSGNDPLSAITKAHQGANPFDALKGLAPQ